jgi:hypothetical protein
MWPFKFLQRSAVAPKACEVPGLADVSEQLVRRVMYMPIVLFTLSVKMPAQNFIAPFNRAGFVHRACSSSASTPVPAETPTISAYIHSFIQR